MPSHPLLGQVDMLFNCYDLILGRSYLPLLIAGGGSCSANASSVLDCGGSASWHMSITYTKILFLGD